MSLFISPRELHNILILGGLYIGYDSDLSQNSLGKTSSLWTISPEDKFTTVFKYHLRFDII